MMVLVSDLVLELHLEHEEELLLWQEPSPFRTNPGLHLGS